MNGLDVLNDRLSRITVTFTDAGCYKLVKTGKITYNLGNIYSKEMLLKDIFNLLYRLKILNLDGYKTVRYDFE